MEKSRTKNTIRNFSSGAIVQLINKLLAFVVRTIFIKALGNEYLGVNGLFTNILTILSFAELGFGTAIIYNMYKPIAEDDKEKIKSLMQLYKKVYNTIGLIVLAVGLLVIPFLKFIIKDTPNIPESIVIIYLLFLLNTVSSYFITYKRSIISAHQQESVINFYTSICYIVKSGLEAIFLIVTKNFIVYLIIEIGCTIIQNIAISKKAEKMFPYLKDENVSDISKDEKKGIFANVKALAMYKFAGTILDGTDNIIISSMFGVGLVGICSNYSLIITSITSILKSALNSIVASIGNLNTTSDKQKKEDIFYQLLFVSFVIYCFCSIAIISLINPFIRIWIGEDYLLQFWIVFALGLSMFVEGTKFAGYTFRTTLGLFVKGKYVPVITALLNIVLSIIMGKYMGLIGIFLATSISRIVTNIWFDPYLIHKHEFNTSMIKFIKKYVIYLILFSIETFICVKISNAIKAENLITLIFNGVIVSIIINLINLALFYNTKEFKALKEKFIAPIKRKLKIGC